MEGPQAARMWGAYEFGGHRVTVIQQWRDPFGRNMVRIQTTGPGPEQAIGLPEAEFLGDAVAVPGPGPGCD